MKKTTKIIAGILLLSVSTGLFAGCKDKTEITPEQQEWITKIEQWYPDDEFTYNGHAVRLMGRSSDVIVLKSRNFPDEYFEFGESNGEIVSRYPSVYHKEACEEYFAGLVKDAFDCANAVAEYKTSAVNCEYVSDEEFIEKYMANDFTIELRYSEGTNVTQAVMVSRILSFVDSLGEDANLRFYVCRGDEPRDETGTDANYSISLVHDNVTSFRVRENGARDSEELIGNMPLATALEMYGINTVLYTIDEEPDMDKLMEWYPEFFDPDVPIPNGVEVYVWQMSEDSYSFGLMFGTDTSKTDEEIMALAERPLTLSEAKALLNECGVSRDEITIIPVIQPISSYEYEIDDEYRERVSRLFD